MLMTEQEARRKWCPMVRIARREIVNEFEDEQSTTVVAGCNTDALGGVRVPASCLCIGGECAMWRFVPATSPRTGMRRFSFCGDESAIDEPPRPEGVPDSWVFESFDGDPAAWAEPQDEADQRRRGYCGLAGRPEVAE